MSAESISESELQTRAEAHRAFVREIDREMGVVYGYGGGAVLTAIAAVIAIGWYTTLFGGFATALFSLTIGLVGLALVRRVVNGRKPIYRRRVEEYCEANGLEPELLREYYARDNMYPYFVAVFEEPRRDALTETPGS